MSVITVKAAERMRTSHMFSVLMTSQFTRQFEYLFSVLLSFCFVFWFYYNYLNGFRRI